MARFDKVDDEGVDNRSIETLTLPASIEVIRNCEGSTMGRLFGEEDEDERFVTNSSIRRVPKDGSLRIESKFKSNVRRIEIGGEVDDDGGVGCDGCDDGRDGFVMFVDVDGIVLILSFAMDRCDDGADVCNC